MLRLLSYNHLFVYALLFLFTAAARFPSFHPQYVGDDEAYYLTAGEKIVEGGVQYVDTWDNKPPILTWFYAIFAWIFGSGALIAVRVFTVLYVFAGALLLNRMAVDSRLLGRFSLLPAFFYILITAIPWYAQELNGELLLSLPMIGTVYLFSFLKERDSRNSGLLFQAGLLLGICFMIKYQAIFLFLGLGISYVVIFPPRLRESFSYIAGFLLIIALCCLVLYFRGALEAFWDIGVLYNLDYMLQGQNAFEELNPLQNLGDYAELWGGIFVLGLLAIVHFRLSYFTNSIRLRKLETVVLAWFFAALLTIVIGWSRLYLHYFYILAPPLAIYAAKFFEFRMNGYLRSLVLIVVLAFPLINFGTYGLSAYPDTFSYMESRLTPGGWIHGLRRQLNEEHHLAPFISPENSPNGILILQYEPAWYVKLGVRCATRYTNFSIAWYKSEIFPKPGNAGLVSRRESAQDMYLAFREDMPDWIVDPKGIFPHIEARLPLIAVEYKSYLVKSPFGPYLIYERIPGITPLSGI